MRRRLKTARNRACAREMRVTSAHATAHPAGPALRAGVALMLLLGGCATPARSDMAVSSQASVESSAWVQPSTQPGHYEYPGLRSITVNGVALTPQAALDDANRHYGHMLPQIRPESQTIPKTLRIVLPDHDRMRPLALQQLKTRVSGAVEFLAERERLDLHHLADVMVRSRLFRDVTIVEQNDTAAPDPAGADFLLWFQVRSLTPNNAGPWLGHWEFKSAHGPRIEPVALDPGTPIGVARLESFVKSVRLAAGDLDRSGGGVFAAANGPRQQRSNGSGIVIDADGHVLTNNHVVAACPDLRVTDTSGESGAATLVATDAANDLALLKTRRHWGTWASFRDSRALQPGEMLVATGFPLTGLVASDMAVTTGSLTRLAGARGDTRQFEFSAPVQPGNSGGPVLDATGHVVGITASMLNGLLVAVATGGAVPQNVNFAIKSTTAREFLDANRVSMDEGGSRQALSPAAVADRARRFTVRVECWR